MSISTLACSRKQTLTNSELDLDLLPLLQFVSQTELSVSANRMCAALFLQI